LSGRVTVVGLGPGDAAGRTAEVVAALAAATDLVGYSTYLDLVAPEEADGATRHASDNRVEAERSRDALDLAATGAAVVVVSSGDPGVFAMAAAVMEQLDEAADPSWAEVAVSVLPGVSAAQSAASRAGAPLGHDFCVLSLSDNLKPWSIIEQRLDAAAGADFVIALYNPRSRARPDQFGIAVDVLLRHRAPETPVVLGRDIGRPAESVAVVALGELGTAAGQERVDMRTVVIVGSSTTRTFTAPDGTAFTYTPRRYS
jgi:cobalt-precorrin 5A hydrolase/precorrin-3B C17-methyltransferase